MTQLLPTSMLVTQQTLSKENIATRLIVAINHNLVVYQCIRENGGWDNWYNTEGQTSGFITKFKTPYSNDSRFLFITVHGAGHEVPSYKPKDALELFEMYINNKI